MQHMYMFSTTVHGSWYACMHAWYWIDRSITSGQWWLRVLKKFSQ